MRSRNRSIEVQCIAAFACANETRVRWRPYECGFQIDQYRRRRIQIAVERQCCRPKLGAMRWDSSLRHGVQGNFVAVAEKRTLAWLADRMPAWMNSDHLTAIGAAGQLLVGCSYLLARWNRWGLLLAIFFLAVNWFGDSLDGTLARHRDQQRPRYGFYVDHVLDSLGSLFLCAGLAVSGYMHPLVAMAMLVAFLMLSVETYLATYTLSKFQMSHWIFGPTEIRIILAIGNLALFLRGPWAHLGDRVYRLFDIGGVCAVIGMGLMFAIAAIRHTVTLYRQEPL